MKPDKRNKYQIDAQFLRNLSLTQLQELIEAFPQFMNRQVVATTLFLKTFWREMEKNMQQEQTEAGLQQRMQQLKNMWEWAKNKSPVYCNLAH